jgi:hypothetical protein
MHTASITTAMITLTMVAGNAYETQANCYKTMQHNIPGGCHLQNKITFCCFGFQTTASTKK